MSEATPPTSSAPSPNATRREAAADTDCLYDAYVSYAVEDRDWVEATLAPRLEKAGRSVCLEHQLAPGGYEIEERNRAIAASRKTLLVLSPAYLDNRWALLEEAATHELDPAARKRRLIPVLRDECNAPLRVRPLVAVDLRGDDARQWQRLEQALDPQMPEPAGYIQKASLRLAEATSDLELPTWHPRGVCLIVIAYLGVLASWLLGLLLFWSIEPLRHALMALPAAAHGAVALAWREDHDALRRLSHLVDRGHAPRVAIVVVMLWVGVGWWQLGVPEARRLSCAPWPCPEPGKLYLAVDAFDATLGTLGSATGGDDLAITKTWAENTRQALVQKLGAASDIKILGQQKLARADVSTLSEMPVDYTLTGQLENARPLVLRAAIYDRERILQPPGISVESLSLTSLPRAEEESFAKLKALQDALAFAIFERLGIDLPDESVKRLAAIPSTDSAAMALNDEAVALRRAGDHEAAEQKLRRAIELDDGYAIAWSNLGELLWHGGRTDEALTCHRNAAGRLPTYAPLHYNLGNRLAFLGRYQEARAALEEALRLDPAYALAYNEVGKVWLKLDQPASAVEAFERGRLLDDEFAPLAKNLGWAHLARGRPKDAVAVLEEALDLYAAKDFTGRMEAHALLVEALAFLRRTVDACRHLDALRRLDPDGIGPWTPDAEAVGATLCPSLDNKETAHVQNAVRS